MPHQILTVRRVALAVATLALAFTTACQSSGQSAVSGRRDDVRHVAQKTVWATRPHMVRQCKPGTKRVPRKTKRGTTYTTTRTTICTKVRSGDETYRKVVRRARWCVELDDVGSKSNDDVWYEVSQGTYYRALGLTEGNKIKFTPLRRGC